MNVKIVAAFLSGGVLASGIVYMAVRPTALPKAAPVSDVRPVEVPPPPPSPSKQLIAENNAPTQPPAPKPEAKPAIVRTPKPLQQHIRLSQKPIREKPSPLPPVRRNEPVGARNEVARNEPPRVQPPPATQPAPEPPQPVITTPAPPPEPEPTPVQQAAPAPISTPEVRQPHTVVLTAGTLLTVRMGETVSAARSQIGDTFVATLEQPLVIDGFIICDRGSRVVGKVTQATPAGRAGGQSHLSLELTRLNTSDRQRVDIRTETYSRDGLGSTGSDLAKIGAGTVIGAAIGGIAGGGKGAAIGAGAGAAAGTGLVLISNGRSVEVSAEARVSFRVREPVTITEKLD